jgi:glycerol uptake facilitator protein
MNIYLAEFLGTMLIILLGEGVVAGVVLKGTKSENAGWLAICIAWGLAVTMGIYAAGEVSGAHLNPAITIALAVTGQFEWNNVMGYCAAQFTGAFIINPFGKILPMPLQSWPCSPLHRLSEIPFRTL